jgi:secondary thiamine-phosphate synthase enzyme
VPITWQSVTVTATQHTQLLDITDDVARACRSESVGEGLALVYCPHTTAGVLIQEAEPGLLHDLEAWLARAIPNDGRYRHDRIDDNAVSHLRAVLAGASVIVPIRNGRLALGTWQRVLLAELDGPRRREVHVGIVV